MSGLCDHCDRGIAIVEDEKDLVSVYEHIFGRKGLAICFIACNGEEAVRMFAECSPKPCVIIMDYRMPLMNGVDAMIEILKIDPGVKIVFLSGDDRVKDEAMRAGASIFLKKPARIKEITDAVTAGLDRASI